jgi:hypothetical protein
VLTKEVDYLKGIIDRLLIKNGVAVVKEPEPELPEQEDKAEVYGE